MIQSERDIAREDPRKGEERYDKHRGHLPADHATVHEIAEAEKECYGTPFPDRAAAKTKEHLPDLGERTAVCHRGKRGRAALKLGEVGSNRRTDLGEGEKHEHARGDRGVST